ncbi:MAG: ribonuclease J [Patescibacteria group bacterium]|nr:ribonuclease J [Patescibacteria group bacterium]MBU2509661.1 ribonuclease J [Patescibacteria group bacterium]
MEIFTNGSSSFSGQGVASGGSRSNFGGRNKRRGAFKGRNTSASRNQKNLPRITKEEDASDIIAKAVKQASLNHKNNNDSKSSASKTKKPSSGKKRQPSRMGGAFSAPTRMHTYKNKPYLKTGKDVDSLSGKGDRLKIMILGGNEEVGRNCTLLEYGKDIIIIDLGLQFPDEDMPGVDYIIPNTSCLKGKEKNIRGVIITHAHLDHIGAIPHVMPRIGNPPLYATDLTGAIIKKRQEDHRGSPPLKLHTIQTKDVLQLGSFKVEFFGVAHSVPTALGIAIHTPCGTIVHTGDFKLDSSDKRQSVEDRDKMIALGKKGVLALMIDSTNACLTGRQIQEGEIQTNIDDIISNAKGRVIIGTFSSMISRIKQIILACEKLDRKVAIEGFSMKSNIAIAQELGYMNIKKGTLIDAKQISNYPPNKIAIVCTGAQGEERAVLMRIANREHSHIEIEPGDTIVFSSSVIPGNERSVQRVKDTLYREGANVVHYNMMDVHAGGHAKQDDLVEMHKMIKPKYLIPIEGHHAFLREHAKAAIAGGFKPEENILIADNGQIIEFDKSGKGQLTNKKVITEYVFVDGLGVGDTNHIVLRDRRELADDGIVIVIAVVEQRTGILLNMPDIISRGFIYMKDNRELIQKSRQKIEDILKDKDPRSSANGTYLKDRIKDELGDFLFHKTQRRPMIMPIVIEV